MIFTDFKTVFILILSRTSVTIMTPPKYRKKNHKINTNLKNVIEIWKIKSI